MDRLVMLVALSGDQKEVLCQPFVMKRACNTRVRPRIAGFLLSASRASLPFTTIPPDGLPTV